MPVPSLWFTALGCSRTQRRYSWCINSVVCIADSHTRSITSVDKADQRSLLLHQQQSALCAATMTARPVQVSAETDHFRLTLVQQRSADEVQGAMLAEACSVARIQPKWLQEHENGGYPCHPHARRPCVFSHKHDHLHSSLRTSKHLNVHRPHA